MMLQNKHILITGASSGIGKSIALLFAKQGACLTITGRDASRLEETRLACDVFKTCKAITADLTDLKAIDELVARLPELDGVVHAAGIIYPLPVKFIGSKHIQEAFSINYQAPVLLMSGLFRSRKVSNGASIIFISSVSVSHPYAGGALYVSSKAALNAYARTIAVEYANKHIRSNLLSPGLVRTPILEQTIAASGPDKLKEFERAYPLGFGEPEDVAEAALFFISERSKWITGQELIMDGGLTLGV